MHPIIEEYLYTPNAIEKQQLAKGEFVFDLPQASLSQNKNQMTFTKEYFLNKHPIYLSKHNRFAAYPTHTHEFLEMNYMLSGKCYQNINGKRILLDTGSVLLLDKGSSHSIEALGENDCLINVIFKNPNQNLSWLSTLNQKNSLVFEFLMNQLPSRASHRYLLFNSGQNEHVQEIMQRMIHTYFLEQELADTMISLYIPILITELVANVPFSGPEKLSQEQDLLLKVLNKIEETNGEITLKELAKQLNYHPNYLSGKIKQVSQLSFGELITDYRMKRAQFLLLNTAESIEEIMQTIGLNNKTHFYQKFKSAYQANPAQYRKIHLQQGS